MGSREAGQLNQRWYRRTDRGARGPIAAFLPLAVIFLCEAVMAQSIPDAWGWMMEQPWSVVLTYAVLFLAQTLLERLTTSLLLGAACTMLPCFLLAVASHLKLATNGVPLLFSDLTMIGEAAQIAGFLNPEHGIGWMTWLGIFLTLALLFLAFLWDRPVIRVRWWQRLLTAAGVAVALAVTLTLPVVGTFLEDRVYGESQAERNDRLGVLAGMYAAALKSNQVAPDEYTEDNMNRLLLQISAAAKRVRTPEVKPNVVVLLSESFFDPTRLPNVTYSTDPIPNYHRLAQENPAGLFMTCAFSGGTGVAEMEILTGISTNILEGQENMTNITGAGAYECMPSLVKAFTSQGYQSTYVHSHTSRLYSRTAHMPAIGFENVYFRNEFVNEWEVICRSWSEDFVSDNCWADEMITRFEEKEEGQPIFLFGLNMENHQPYYTNKYFGEPSPVTFESDLITEPGDVGVFDALLHGLYDADAALGKLIDYFSTVDEPTIVVFMGDHLPRPNFDDAESDTLFDRLGYSTTADTIQWDADELKRMLSTNYLVWNNYGAEFDVPETLSTVSVGTRLLDWAGLPKPLFYSFLDTVLEDVLIYRDRLFVSADGYATKQIPPRYESLMKRYRTVVYDTLYGQRYITEGLTGSKVRETVTDTMPDVISPDEMGSEYESEETEPPGGEELSGGETAPPEGGEETG